MSYMPVTVASRLQHDRCSITVRWEDKARVNFYISRSSLGFSMIAPTSIHQEFVAWARGEKKSMTAVLEHFDKISFGAAADALTGKTFPSFKKFAAAALAVTKGKMAAKSAKSTVHASDAAPSRNDKTREAAKTIDLAACSSEQLRIIAKSMGLDESAAFREDGARWLYTGITRAARELTLVLGGAGRAVVGSVGRPGL